MAGMATVGALRVTLGLDSAQFTNGLSAAQKQLRGVSAQMQGVGQKMAQTGALITAGITAPLVALGIQFARAAIDVEEMQSAFSVSFGAMSRDVEAWAVSTGDAMGRSTFELQKMALGFNGLFKAGGPITEMSTDLSKQFVVLAQDLASFHNVAEQDVFSALRSGLSGEAEPLRQFNVYLNEATVKAEAYAMGLAAVGSELTEQQKIQARASLILKGTAEAQGDVTRTSGSTANQLRALSAQWSELSVTLGQKIVPLITPVVEGLNRMLLAFSKMSPQMQQVVLVGGALAAALGPVLVVVGSVVGAVGLLIASPLLPFLAGAAAAVVAVGAAFAIWGKDLTPIVQKFGKALVDAVGPTIPPLVKAMRSAFEALGPVVKFVGTVMIGAFGPVVITALRLLAAGFTTTFNVIGQTLRVIGALIRGDWSGAWNAAGSLIMDIVKGIGSLVEAVFPGITENVRRMVDGVTKWLTGKLFDVLRGVISRVKGVSDAFFRLYDAVVGNSYVPDMVEGVAHWMSKLDAVMVAPAERATRTTAQAFQTLRDDVAAIMEGLLTDLERSEREYASKAAKLAERLASGALQQGPYDQAMSRLDRQRADARFRDTQGTRDRMGAVAGGVGDVFATSRETAAGVFGSVRDAMGQAAESVSGALQNVSSEMEASGERFAQNFARTFEGILRGDLSGVLNDVLNSVLRSALLNVGRMLHGFGSQQGGIIGSLFKLLPGFATGGSFKVGGRAGVDQNLVAFRATKGEMVDIRRPGQDRGGSGGSVSFDLRGAVMTGDLLAQMERMAAESGGAVLNAARAVIPAEQARKRRFGYA